MKAMAPRRRVQLDVSKDGIERLERLKNRLDTGSYAEVVRRALGVYDWLLNEVVVGGKKIYIGEGESLREVELFADVCRPTPEEAP